MSKDLVALVADAQQEQTLLTLLRERGPSLGIRSVTFDIFRHPHKDPGVFHATADFLAGYRPPAYDRALVMLDAAWDGAPGNADFLRQALLGKLTACGWTQDRCQVIVIDPELEIWVWANSPIVPEVLRTSWEAIRVLADRHGYWREGAAKPHEPKALFEAVLWQTRRPRSGAIFRELARRVGLAGCQDMAFVLLRETLAGWFGSK
jgi:hypothetical protein